MGLKARDTDMERAKVHSSVIRSIGYSYKKRILEIEFNKGAVYQYLDLPSDVFKEFKSSGSKGKFFNRVIKNQYHEVRIA